MARFQLNVGGGGGVLITHVYIHTSTTAAAVIQNKNGGRHHRQQLKRKFPSANNKSTIWCRCEAGNDIRQNNVEMSSAIIVRCSCDHNALRRNNERLKRATSTLCIAGWQDVESKGGGV